MVEIQVPIRTLQRDTSEILRRERYQRNIERTTRRMKPYSPTSRDTVYNLDTASNPSSPPHFTNDIPSTVLQVRTRSITKDIIYDPGSKMVMKVNAQFVEHR